MDYVVMWRNLIKSNDKELVPFYFYFSRTLQIVKVPKRTLVSRCVLASKYWHKSLKTLHGGHQQRHYEFNILRDIQSRSYHAITCRNSIGSQQHHFRMYAGQLRSFMILRVIRAASKVRYLLLGAAGATGVSAKLVWNLFE